MDDRYQYLLLMAGCLLVTLPLEFVLRARVYRRPRRLLYALAAGARRLRRLGRRGDRPRALVVQRAVHDRHPLPLDVPLEELVFFVVIPVCGLLTYEAVGTVLGWVRQWRGRDA